MFNEVLGKITFQDPLFSGYITVLKVNGIFSLVLFITCANAFGGVVVSIQYSGVDSLGLLGRYITHSHTCDIPSSGLVQFFPLRIYWWLSQYQAFILTCIDVFGKSIFLVLYLIPWFFSLVYLFNLFCKCRFFPSLVLFGVSIRIVRLVRYVD